MAGLINNFLGLQNIKIEFNKRFKCYKIDFIEKIPYN